MALDGGLLNRCEEGSLPPIPQEPQLYSRLFRRYLHLSASCCSIALMVGWYLTAFSAQIGMIVSSLSFRGTVQGYNINNTLFNMAGCWPDPPSLPSSISLSLSRWTWVCRYQNVSILDLIGAKDDGVSGDNWNYKTCKSPVESSPPKNEHH